MIVVFVVEMVMLYIFINIVSCMIIVLLIIGFLAFLYLDSYYILLFMIVWPIIMYLYLMMSSILGRVKLNLVIKIIYTNLISVLVGRLILMYILGIFVMGVAVLYVVGGYVEYWMLRVNILALRLILYILVEVKLMWLGVLPMVMFFIKQNLMIVIFILKLVWLY